MTIEEALDAYLKANTTLTALIPATRIYEGAIPQDQTTFPCLVHRFVSGDETPYLGGEANDLHRDNFELSVVGDVRKQCAAARDVLLEMFAGTTPRGLWQPGIFVSGCMTGGTAANIEPPVDGSERRDRENSVALMVIWGRR